MTSQWTVYILRCLDGSLYTGITTDIQKRVEAHNAGRGAAYTASRRPVAVVWKICATSRSAALIQESAIKRLTRQEKLALINGTSM